MPPYPYGGADEEDYSSSDDGSSYASSEEEFEAPPPPPPMEDLPASDAIVVAAPRDMVVHDENEDDDDDDDEGSEDDDEDNDEEQQEAAVNSREPVETPTKTKQPSPYNSNSAAAVAASTLASKPQSLYHHTQNYQDPDEVAEELEITSSPTLKRLNKEEKAARRKQWCHEKRYVILGAVLLVLVAIAVALGVVFGGANSGGSKSGGGSVNIPDDFPSQPDDFAGPSISTAGDNTGGGAPSSPTAPTNDNVISGPSPAPTDPRDPSLAALTDYLKSLEETDGADSALSDPNSPQAQARNYVLTTLTQDDVDVLAALVKTGTEGNPNDGVQLRVGQLYGLATAFLSTDGDRWANRDGWMGNVGSSANDPCGWNGVTCVGDVQTVTDLPADMNSGAAASTGGRKLSSSIASDRKTHIDDIQRRARSSNANAGNGRKLQQDLPANAIIEIDLGENGLNGQLPADFGTYFPYIRTLSMPSNNLRGPLPETLFNGQNPDLQIVDLYDNNFSGSISPDIGNMNNLLVLGVGNNDIEGQIPASLPTSMQFLELSGNDLFGNIPGDAIGAMPDLENFAVSDNERLVGPIPGAMFSSKDKLLRLELDDCNFDGSIPPEIGQARALNYINANGNALLSGEIPEELYSLADLDTLLLYETAVSGSISSSIGQLTKLQILFLNDNNLSGPIPAEIGNCQSLVELKMDDNNLTGGIPAEITTLPLLERLHIHNNVELRGEIPDSIGDLVSLRELFLYSSGISGAVPDSIGELSNLVTLALNNNELTEITDKVEGLTSLQVLDLAQNGLEKLPKNIGKLSELQELYLSSNRFEGQIDKGLSELTKLRRFYAENNFFSGDAPDFSKMVDLEELGLAYNKVEGDNKFPGFEGDLPNLGGLRSLQVVRLHENSFEGELDANYGSLLSLTELRLESNNLEGPIPAFWGFASLLEELTLFQNPGITGPMPAEICSLAESGNLDRLVVDCAVECTCCTDCFDG